MKVQETCGCGASIEVEGTGLWPMEAADAWRSNHKHVLCRPGSTESDEPVGAGVVIPERDPRSTTDAYVESAGPFGFNRRSEDVIA